MQLCWLKEAYRTMIVGGTPKYELACLDDFTTYLLLFLIFIAGLVAGLQILYWYYWLKRNKK